MTPALIHIAGAPIGLRDAEAGDVAYVIRTWLDSMAHRISSRRRAAMRTRERPALERDLAECGAIVACSPEHPSTIHGWACGAAGASAILHYVYVPYALRGQGLARALITARLRGYPDRIEVSRRWPWPSDRYVYTTRNEKQENAA